MPGSYDPPSWDFDRVIINLTVTSAGKQFDRLGIMFLDDIEVFRTSTAEPTLDGIYWTYIKDMTDQLALFKVPRRITFDLGNLIDDTYTASFNVTISAAFSFDNTTIEPEIRRQPADLILPVTSAKKYASINSSSAFLLPAERASRTHKIPRNAKRALFSISACGQAEEEFWWSNAMTSQTETFRKTVLLGHSPFRELQLFIDERLAGVAWPFPIIFTGGIVPGLWRPIVGIDAFDLRDDEIDVSPWLPYLSDGKEHQFEIRIVGLADDAYANGTNSSKSGKVGEKINSYWVVSGKLHLWLDEDSDITSGGQLRHFASEPVISIASEVTKSEDCSHNESLAYDVAVKRHLFTVAYVTTSEGSRLATWSQDLSYSARNELTEEGVSQITQFGSKGKYVSSSFDAKREHGYQMFVNTTFDAKEDTSSFRIDGMVNRLKYENFHNVFNDPKRDSLKNGLESFSKNWQNATGKYFANPEKLVSYTFGTTDQILEYSASSISHGRNVSEYYKKHALATNGTVVCNNSSGGKDDVACMPATNGDAFLRRMSVKSLLGRAPRV